MKRPLWSCRGVFIRANTWYDAREYFRTTFGQDLNPAEIWPEKDRNSDVMTVSADEFNACDVTPPTNQELAAAHVEEVRAKAYARGRADALAEVVAKVKESKQTNPVEKCQIIGWLESLR